MDRLRIDGVELEYEITGAGAPVVFIDGAFITGTFRPLLSEASLTSQFRAILYHRRGYAGSTLSDGPVSIAQHAADCRDLLRHLGLDRAHVVGHSYGGAVALQLAIDAPGMVRSLTLLEPALAVGASATAYRASLKRSETRYRDADTATVLDEFLEARSPGYRAILDRVLPGAFEQAVTDAETWFSSDLPGLLVWRFGEAEARRIGQPVLSLLGGDSAALSPRFEETHRLLLEWLPHGEGFVVPGATHLMQITHPGVVARALTSFLGRHPIA